MRLLVFVAAFALAACGGSTTVTLCNGTVMGKLSGTFSVCNALEQRYRANLDTYQLTGEYTELPTSFTWSTAWELKGEPSAKQYNQNTADIECNITMRKGALTWLAQKGAGVPAAGTCQLTLSDVVANETMGNVTTYKVKGVISATLEAQPGSGATETVTVSMDLCQGDKVLCVPPAMM